MASANSKDDLRCQLRITIWEEEEFEVLFHHLDLTTPPDRSADRFVDPWTLETIGAADDPDRFRVEPEPEPEPEPDFLPGSLVLP
jgi:hypothetical protein